VSFSDSYPKFSTIEGEKKFSSCETPLFDGQLLSFSERIETIAGAQLLNLRTTKKERSDSRIGECVVLFPSCDATTTLLKM